MVAAWLLAAGKQTLQILKKLLQVFPVVLEGRRQQAEGIVI